MKRERNGLRIKLKERLLWEDSELKIQSKQFSNSSMIQGELKPPD
jgi:hypothetical protein